MGKVFKFFQISNILIVSFLFFSPCIPLRGLAGGFINQGKGKISLTYNLIEGRKYFDQSGNIHRISYSSALYGGSHYSEHRLTLNAEYDLTGWMSLEIDIPFLYREVDMPEVSWYLSQDGTIFADIKTVPASNTGLGDIRAGIILQPLSIFWKNNLSFNSKIFLEIKFPTGDKNGDFEKAKIPLGTGQTDYSLGMFLSYSFNFIEPSLTFNYTWRTATNGLKYWVADIFTKEIDPGDEIHIKADVKFYPTKNLDISLGLNEILSEGMLIKGQYIVDYILLGGLYETPPEFVAEHSYITYLSAKIQYRVSKTGMILSAGFFYPLMGKNYPEAVGYSDIKNINGLFLTRNFPQVPGNIVSFKVGYEF